MQNPKSHGIHEIQERVDMETKLTEIETVVLVVVVILIFLCTVITGIALGLR